MPPQLPPAAANSGLMSATVGVTDPNLAACLMAVGVPLRPGEEISMMTGDASGVSFNFLPISAEGMKAEDCIRAWNQERHSKRPADDFSGQNPEHPFSYAMATICNRIALDKYLRNTKAAVCIKRGSSIAALDPALERVKADYILARIGV